MNFDLEGAVYRSTQRLEGEAGALLDWGRGRIVGGGGNLGQDSRWGGGKVNPLQTGYIYIYRGLRAGKKGGNLLFRAGHKELARGAYQIEES